MSVKLNVSDRKPKTWNRPGEEKQVVMMIS